jgi:hypothetical protein
VSSISLQWCKAEPRSRAFIVTILEDMAKPLELVSMRNLQKFGEARHKKPKML